VSALLRSYAHTYSLAVVVTNQVTDVFDLDADLPTKKVGLLSSLDLRRRSLCQRCSAWRRAHAWQPVEAQLGWHISQIGREAHTESCSKGQGRSSQKEEMGIPQNTNC